MTGDEFRAYLTYGTERQGVEFKGPGTLKDLAPKVVRAVLSMANRRDGGYVIIGVDDDGVALMPTGLSREALTTWKSDHVADKVAEYADPNVAFDLERLPFEGKDFVVIRVHEFEDLPILCKKPYQTGRGKSTETILRKGACYVRTVRKPETAEIPTHEEMRALLDLASEKRVRALLQSAQRTGILDMASAASDEQAFRSQREQTQDDELTEMIRSKGYWQVVISPATFEPRRVRDYAELDEIVARAQVRTAAITFPAAIPGLGRRRGEDWIGRQIDLPPHVESWRLFQSGQFFHVAGMVWDWEEPSPIRDLLGQPVRALGPLTALMRCTAIFEFAARLAVADAGADRMHVEFTVGDLAGRVLYGDHPRRMTGVMTQPTDAERFISAEVYERTDLLARPRELACSVTRQLLQRFGFNPPLDLLRELQDELGQLS